MRTHWEHPACHGYSRRVHTYRRPVAPRFLHGRRRSSPRGSVRNEIAVLAIQPTSLFQELSRYVLVRARANTSVDPDHSIWCVAVSPDGRFALSGGEYECAALWHIATGRLTRRFGSGSSTFIAAVAFFARLPTSRDRRRQRQCATLGHRERAGTSPSG